MKNLFFVAFFLALFIACKPKSATDNQAAAPINADSIARAAAPPPVEIDYSGVYRSSEKACKMTLTISKIGEAYRYQLATAKRNKSGKLILSELDGAAYLTFEGLLGADKKDLEASYDNGVVRIQNTGNATNAYQHFKECDAKYIELTQSNDPEPTVAPTVEKPVKKATPIKPKAPAAPLVSVNSKGEISLSGKKVAYEDFRKELQTKLLTYLEIPNKISLKTQGQVGMGTRQEVETLINEAIGGAKWARKKAAMEALNAPISKKLETYTELQIISYKTSGAYAFIDARPLQAGGNAINYYQTPYAAAYHAGTHADRAIGLLKYEKGAWKVLIYTLGVNQVSSSTWMKKYGAPKALFTK